MGVFLLSALLVAGCGGGGGGDISRAAFVDRAGVVCQRTAKRIQAEFAAYGRSGKAKEVERAERAGELTYAEAAVLVARKILIPAKRRELEELRALGLPSADTARVTALLKAFGEGIEKAERRPERAVQDGTEAFGKQERLADEYGIEGC